MLGCRPHWRFRYGFSLLDGEQVLSVAPGPGKQETLSEAWLDGAGDGQTEGVQGGARSPWGHHEAWGACCPHWEVHRGMIPWEGSGAANLPESESSRKGAGEECHWLFLTHIPGSLVIEASRKQNSGLKKQKELLPTAIPFPRPRPPPAMSTIIHALCKGKCLRSVEFHYHRSRW